MSVWHTRGDYASGFDGCGMACPQGLQGGQEHVLERAWFLGFTDYSHVDKLSLRYKSVNFGAGKNPRQQNGGENPRQQNGGAQKEKLGSRKRLHWRWGVPGGVAGAHCSTS